MLQMETLPHAHIKANARHMGMGAGAKVTGATGMTRRKNAMINMCNGFLKECNSCNARDGCGIYDAYIYGIDSGSEKPIRESIWDIYNRGEKEGATEFVKWVLNNKHLNDAKRSLLMSYLAEWQKGEENDK